MSKDNKTTNPWLGLKAYSEGDTLYGRDDDILMLSQYVTSNVETLLYGRSGIGKSSIINAGVIPVVRKRDIVPVPLRLVHDSESHEPYVKQLRKAIEDAGLKIVNTQPAREPDAELLWELFHGNRFVDPWGRQARLLVLIDQFEEIFTLQSNSQLRRELFSQLADLINNSRPAQLETETATPAGNSAQSPAIQSQSPDDDDDLLLDLGLDDMAEENYVYDNEFHIVFTLREDFLSDFEYYTGQIPSLKHHRFGLRPINDEQAADIIMKPRPSLVTKQVAALIIEKVTGRTDFSIDGVPEIDVDSAVLSLFLNRLYDSMASKGQEQITAGLVNEMEGKIISDFYDSCTHDIPAEKVDMLEDRLLNEEGRRENKSYSVLCREIGKRHIDTLIGRQLLRKFAYSGEMRVELIHDILCPVVRLRKEQRQQEIERQARLAEEQARMAALEAERERMLEENKRIRRRNRNLKFAIVAVVIAVAGGIFAYRHIFVEEHSAYYRSFTTAYGWPVGVGQRMHRAERFGTALFYKLSHEGYSNRDTDVKVRTTRGASALTTRIGAFEVDEDDENGADAKARQYYSMLKRVRRVHYVAGESGKIDKEIAYDDNGNVLFCKSYYHLAATNEAWMVFTTESGQPMPIRDNGVDRVRIKWDDRGRIVLARYYDADGACRQVAKGACGYTATYDDTTGATTTYLIDDVARPMTGIDYNAITITLYPDSTVTQYARATSLNDTLPQPALGPEGFSQIVRKGNVEYCYDQNLVDGPVVTTAYKQDPQGNILQAVSRDDRRSFWSRSFRPDSVNYTYDNDGYLTQLEYLNRDGSPSSLRGDSIYKKVWKYDNGTIVHEERIRDNGTTAYLHSVATAGNVTTEITDSLGFYTERRVTLLGPDSVSIEHFGRNGEKAFHTETDDEGLSIAYHKVTVATVGNTERRYYCTIDGNGDVVPCQNALGDDGSPISFYCKEEVRDQDNLLTQLKLYGKDGSIFKSMRYYNSNGQRIARAAAGIDGNPVRNPDLEIEGLAYYKLYHSYNLAEDFTSFYPVNEWEQESVLFGSGVYLVNQSFDMKGWEARESSESDLIIPISNEYSQFMLGIMPDADLSQVEVPYLCISSRESQLYKAGLRDGDRIVELGKWRLGDSRQALASQWEALKATPMKLTVIRPTAEATQEIEVTVARGKGNLETYYQFRITTQEFCQLSIDGIAGKYFKLNP